MQEYIALGVFRIDLPSVGQYEKGCGQYIPALTSHSVNKSIKLFLALKKINSQVFSFSTKSRSQGQKHTCLNLCQD